MKKYKVELTCWDYGVSEPQPYKEEIGTVFEDYKDAMIFLLRAVIDELDCLNNPVEANPVQRYFVTDLEEGYGFDAIIRVWNDAEEWTNVTGYKIITIEENE